MKMMDAVAALGVAGMSDMDKLTKWIAESRLDPNDPSNAELMYLMRVRFIEKTKQNLHKLFLRINSHCSGTCNLQLQILFQ